MSPIFRDSESLGGLYVAKEQSIVFALGNETRRKVVVHEILHWLVPESAPMLHETREALRARTHPPEYFEKRCGTVLLEAQ